MFNWLYYILSFYLRRNMKFADAPHDADARTRVLVQSVSTVER